MEITASRSLRRARSRARGSKLIDQHYYAIASRATVLKPEAECAQDRFQARFGLAWKDALASGKVFNAMDGCAKLGIDSEQMDAEWAKAKAAKKLVNFGGGFDCRIMYMFNGFFMAMRAKFTQPGTQIYYYNVEWEFYSCLGPTSAARCWARPTPRTPQAIPSVVRSWTSGRSSD